MGLHDRAIAAALRDLGDREVRPPDLEGGAGLRERRQALREMGLAGREVAVAERDAREDSMRAPAR